jgi:hypothetical protein
MTAAPATDAVRTDKKWLSRRRCTASSVRCSTSYHPAKVNV